MFFQQAFKGSNDWWRYIVVSILVFIGYQIGTIPLMLALWRAVDIDPNLDKADIQSFAGNPDFANFGINTNLGLTLMLLLFVAALVVFYFVFKPFHSREFRTIYTTSSRLNWSKIFFAFFAWLSFSLAVEGISYAMNPGDYTWNFQFNTFIPLVALCIFILPLQTSFEELFFRGYLMQGIGTAHINKVIAVVLSASLSLLIRSFLQPMSYSSLSGFIDQYGAENIEDLSGLLSNFIALLIFMGLTTIITKALASKNLEKHKNYKIVPLIITSILFGLIHSSNPEIEKFGFGMMQIYYITAGLLLGIMTIMDDGLELALGTHAATNFTGAVFVGYEGAAINTDSLFISNALDAQLMTAAFVVIAVLFLFVLKLKYNWGSFSKIFDRIEKPDNDIALNQYIDTIPRPNNT